MTWVRDIRDDSASIDRDGTGTAQRGYLWSGPFVDPTVLAMFPHTFLGGDTGVEPLPARGSAHPETPSLKLDVYTVQCEGATSRIRALYSNDGRFNFPPPDDDDADRIDQIRYSSAPEDVRVPYPFAQRVVQAGALIAGQVGPNLPVLLKYGEKVRTESQRRWSWEAIIKEEEIDAAEVAMDNQHNRIHFIRSRYWLFKAAPVEPFRKIGDQRYYRIAYQWLGDTGTNDPLADFPQGILPDRGPISGTPHFTFYFPKQTAGIGPNATIPGVAITRKPFHTFSVGPEEIVAGEPHPLFLQYLPYIRDDFGWQTLLGIQ